AGERTGLAGAGGAGGGQTGACVRGPRGRAGNSRCAFARNLAARGVSGGGVGAGGVTAASERGGGVCRVARVPVEPRAARWALNPAARGGGLLADAFRGEFPSEMRHGAVRSDWKTGLNLLRRDHCGLLPSRKIKGLPLSGRPVAPSIRLLLNKPD